MFNFLRMDPSPSGLHWSEETGYRAYFKNRPMHERYQQLLVEDLESIHPLLPALITYVCKTYMLKSSYDIPLISFEKTLLEWAKPSAKIKDIKGVTRQITGVHSCELQSGGVLAKLHFSFIDTRDWYPDNSDTPLPVMVRRGVTEAVFLTSVISTQYLDWYERYCAGVALELSEEDMASYMFPTDAPAPNVDMNDLRFDGF